jgi:hypothetical protein
MKTLKTFAIITLVATFTLASTSSAWAHHRHRHHRHHNGAVWGAAVGGTMLGIVMSNMANQPRQTSQPQVVVVQPQNTPSGDAGIQKQYLALELERERARSLAMELEIQRLRAIASDSN